MLLSRLVSSFVSLSLLLASNFVKAADAPSAGAEVTPQAVLDKIHAINHMEIEMANLAKSQGKHGFIKKYANRMVKDHGKADKKVESTAKKENIALGEIAHDPDDTAAMEKLKSLKGDSFDAEYLRVMQDGHTKAIAFLTTAEEKLSPSETLKLVKELKPTIIDHEHEAKVLQKKL